VELDFKGKLEQPKRYIATLYSGQTNDLKGGLYRNSTLAPTGGVDHDAWGQGRSLRDVR
jgi:hypothetical protein